MQTGFRKPLLVLGALLLSSACFIFGVLHHVPNAAYTGLRPMNVTDTNVNLSWIGQVRDGAWLLRNQFTSEPQRGASFRLSYLLLSQPFRLIPVSNLLAYHIQRLILGALLLFLLFHLFRKLGLDDREAWIAFLLLAFSSGIGYLVRRMVPASSDLSVPESNLFLSLGEPPHFLFSLLFLWLGAVSFYRAMQGERTGLAIFMMCLVALWWDHPFDAVILISVCTANIWQLRAMRERLLFAGAGILVSIPALLYYRWLRGSIGFSTLGTSQNLMLSPSILALITGVLPLLILSVPAIVVLWKDPAKRKLLLFLAIWFGVQCLLAYAPVPFQRRLLAGIQFPLVILATQTLRRISNSVVVIVIAAICSIGSFMIMREQIRFIEAGHMPFYLPDSYDRAFRWLDGQPNKGVIVSGYVTGNFIPGYTGYTSCIGHSSLTVNAAQKRQSVEMFYQEPDSQFIRQNGIQLIFWGLEEQHLTKPNLRAIYPALYEGPPVWILAAPR